MENIKQNNNTEIKLSKTEKEPSDDNHNYSFSLDNSLEETYITNINLGKEEEKKEKKSDKEKQDIQKEAEDLKELFLLS
jgi:hypothetical protein